MFDIFWRLFPQKFSVYGLTHKWCHDKKLSHFAAEKCSSTNDCAKEEAFSLSTPLRLYLTDQQLQGRGRGDNTWSNPPVGSALMISFSFALERAPQPILTPLVGLAVSKALKKAFRLKSLSIKAPNDILIGGKKVSGILVEAVQMGNQHRLIIGLGLNVFAPPSGLDEAGCLCHSLGMSKGKWIGFLDQLLVELRLASQESLGSHLSESQRLEILNLLNENPNLENAYDSLSPFGDLSSRDQVTSWRDL